MATGLARVRAGKEGQVLCNQSAEFLLHAGSGGRHALPLTGSIAPLPHTGHQNIVHLCLDMGWMLRQTSGDELAPSVLARDFLQSDGIPCD